MPLASNWRETGSYYVCSRSGSDSNAGTKAPPFATISSVVDLSGTRVIRAGYYNEGEISKTTSSDVLLIADGLVVWDGSSFSSTFSGSTSSINRQHSYDGFIIINHNNFNIPERNDFYREFKNCFVKLSNISQIGQSLNNNNNIFISCLIEDIQNATFFRNTFINTDIVDSDSVTYRNCAFEKNCLVESNSNTNSFINCAFQASVTQVQIHSTDFKTITLDGDSDTIGSTYADGEKFNGVWTDGVGNIWNFTNCCWTDDLGFNDETLDNYTLKISPQSLLFNNNNIIGRFGLAQVFSPNSEAFNPSRSGVSYSNITRNTVDNQFEITTGTSGTVTSSDDIIYAIDLGEDRTIKGAIQFFGSINYFNGEWVDKDNYSAGVNDEVRLTYRVQVYNSISASWSDWYEMEGNVKPELDSSNRGNGNVDFDFPSASDITGRYFRLELTLRNNGV